MTYNILSVPNINFNMSAYRLLYKWTVHEKSLCITTDSNLVIPIMLINLIKLL